MSDDDSPSVLDERRDTLETVVWGGVFLFTLVLFFVEFLHGAFIESFAAGEFPMYFIRSFESSMFVTAILGGGGVVLLIVLAVFRYGTGVRERAATMRPGQDTFKFAVFLLAVTVLLGMTVFQGAATLAKTDEAGPAAAAQQTGISDELEMSVTGGQWFWRYDVAGIPQSQGDVVVLPADTIIQFQVTSADVIHSFAIKTLGVTKDAVPGAVNTAWFSVEDVKGETTLTYSTQDGEQVSVPADTYQVRCAELCGKGHSKMISTVYIVSKDDYRQWAQAKGGTAAFTKPDEGIDLSAGTNRSSDLEPVGDLNV